LSFPQQGIVVAGRFPMREQIGHATLGWLYRVLDPTRGNEAALRLVVTVKDAAAAHGRLRAHIGKLAALGHPGIAKVWDCGMHEGQLWFTSEWLRGRPLDRSVSRSRPLGLTAVKELGLQLTSALGEAHRHGLVHRGLKARNIFVGDGHARAIELGVGATIFADGGVMANTPGSMPQEQMMNDIVDHRSDIYSLGACLFTAIVGRPPFDGGAGDMMAAQAGWKAPRARELNPAVPEALELVLLRAMATRPEDRYQSMAEFGDALSRLRVEAKP
jgi:serine/threonine protein kinase